MRCSDSYKEVTLATSKLEKTYKLAQNWDGVMPIVGPRIRNRKPLSSHCRAPAHAATRHTKSLKIPKKSDNAHASITFTFVHAHTKNLTRVPTLAQQYRDLMKAGDT